MANVCFLVSLLGWTGFTTLLLGYFLRRVGVLRIRYACFVFGAAKLSVFLVLHLGGDSSADRKQQRVLDHSQGGMWRIDRRSSDQIPMHWRL